MARNNAPKNEHFTDPAYGRALNRLRYDYRGNNQRLYSLAVAHFLSVPELHIQSPPPAPEAPLPNARLPHEKCDCVACGAWLSGLLHAPILPRDQFYPRCQTYFKAFFP